MANATYTIPNVASLVAVTSYASGIESMRQAMVSTGTNPALEAYASGTNILARNIETYSSGVEVLRRAMIAGGDTTAVTAYASGINTQLSLVQIHLSEVENYASGTAGTGTGSNPALEGYASGTHALAIINQNNIVNVTSYASGVDGQLISFQNAQTLTNNTLSNNLSGVNTLAILNQTNIVNVTSYASGTKTLVNTLQTNQTSINSTLSGVITDVREIEVYASGVQNLAAHHMHLGNDISFPTIGISTYDDHGDFLRFTGTAGRTCGGTLYDMGSGVLTIISGCGAIRIGPTKTDELKFFDWSLLSGTIPLNTVRYVGIDYNSGTPIAEIRTSDNWNYYDDFPLGMVANVNNVLHIAQNGREFPDQLGRLIRRFYGTRPYERDERIGGLIIGETGTRNVTLSAGRLWDRSNNFDITAINTSGVGGNTFTSYYRDAGNNFIGVENQTQWPNTQYDDGTGALATLNNNWYANLWWYIETDNQLVMLYGREQYATLNAAALGGIPATVPVRITASGRLIGRFIFKNAAATAHEIDTVWNSTLNATGVADHGSLAGLTDADHPITAIVDLDSYLSGTKALIITNQNSLTSNTATVSGINTSLINLNVYASGIETMRRAMVLSNPSLESFASGTNSLANVNQSNITRLEPVLSGIQSVEFFINNRVSTRIVPTAKMLSYDSNYFYATIDKTAGLNDLHTVTFLTEIPNYWSGTKTLANLNQTNITNLTAYASGINAYTQLLAPRTSPFWMRDRSATEITGGAGLSFNNNDFEATVDSNPGLLDDYSYSLNGKYGSSLSGINSNLVNTQARVTTLESSSGGNATKQSITHHTPFSTFRAVYRDSNKVWQYSKANVLENAEVVGVVESTSGNQSTIVMNGVITNNLITAGLVYYLSDVTDGALQTSEATNISKPVMIGIDSGVGIVQIFRSLIVSGSSSAIDLPRSYLAGYGTAPYTTSGISVAAGSARSDNNEFNIITSNTIVKKLTGPFVAGTLQNGIDSGNRAASTTYHVHEITNGTSVDTLFSTSPTSPTLPSGYVASRRIMSFKTDSTGWIPSYSQDGDQILLLTPVFDVNTGALGNTATLATLSTPLGIKTHPMISAWAYKTGAQINIYISSPDVIDNAVARPSADSACSVVTGWSHPQLWGGNKLRTNTSAQIRYRADAASCDLIHIITYGWIDTRGRDS